MTILANNAQFTTVCRKCDSMFTATPETLNNYGRICFDCWSAEMDKEFKDSCAFKWSPLKLLALILPIAMWIGFIIWVCSHR